MWNLKKKVKVIETESRKVIARDWGVGEIGKGWVQKWYKNKQKHVHFKITSKIKHFHVFTYHLHIFKWDNLISNTIKYFHIHIYILIFLMA